MDILTHSLSGLAIGTVLSSYSDKNIKPKIGIIMLAGFAAAVPDLDAISLWSKFDNTIGKVFSLSHKGNEIYYSKFWYSHHGFLHSIIAGILITLFLGILIYLFKKKKTFSLNQKLAFVGLFLGFLIHLFEDMPTPSSVWGGVNLLWPLKPYIGGSGDIWWWNNYDLLIIIFIVVCINLLTLVAEHFIKFKAYKLTTIVFIFGFILSIIQIKSRGIEFNYTGFTSRFNELELKSKEVQKHILGDKIYNIMLSIDSHLPINF